MTMPFVADRTPGIMTMQGVLLCVAPYFPIASMMRIQERIPL